MGVPGRKDSHFKRKLVCQPCQTDGVSLPAEGYCETCNEYFCSACLKVHRKQSATKNHAIKLKDEMPTVQAQTDPCSELCDVHRTEIVKYYCEDHDEVACGDCIILHHKACSVQLVSDASDDYDVIQELTEVKYKAEQILNELRSCKHEIHCIINAAAEMYTKAIREMKYFRTELNIYLDKVESEILIEVEKLKTQDISLQTKLQDECLSMEKEIERFRQGLDENADKINNLFVTAKLAQKKLQISQELTNRIESEGQINSYMFEPSKELLTFKTSKLQFGTLCRQSKIFIEQRNTINVQAAKEDDCFVTGLASISRDKILLADSDNKSLKILNVRKRKITSTYALQAKPWDVTVINKDVAASTLPEEGKILFVNTTNGLSEQRSLKVRSGCKGIDHLNDVIAVSFCHLPLSVQILNMHGDVLNEVRDTKLFGWPGHLVWNKTSKSIYVSDYWRHSVYELRVNGELQVNATLEGRDWRRPRGLAVAKNGTVVVCCEGIDGRLNMIAPDTRAIMPLSLKKMNKPVSILVCEEESKVYVSSHFSTEECNEIKIFDIEFK